MKTYRLETKLWLPQPRATIFEFFSDPHNLDRLTPAWLKFEIRSPRSTVIKAGTLLDYRLRLHGLPIRWQSEITVWQPPACFVDRQVKGPYKLWVHEHTFEEQGTGTMVGDSVEYAVAGGSLAQKFFVGPDLERIFAYRHKILKDIFNLDKSERDPTSGAEKIGV
jgi:ligand-binding SRPBCC domain-containing protein